ncbi:MAG: N-6 DNA methylase [Candidatus Riflebacteria bacterium]|nr:N-6 DNA methylase [Candidatus Riflebacteria bacterium]
MSSRITQHQLESYLWGAAVLLRGTIDAGDYKQFIFPLLFYKRLCDVYDEETGIALKESGGDKDFAAFPENHRFQIPPEAHWREVRKTARNVGPAIHSAMRSIETANPDKLFGIFGDAQWTNKDRLSDTMLRDLIEHFSSLDLTVANLPEDELGQGYEFLIKKFADDSGHTAAEFYTNRTVVHLMTEILEPQPADSIYDPTCGSGGMLLSCIAHLRRQRKEWRNVKLFGQERNLMTSSIARMNCFLHGIEDFQVIRGDTLSEPKFVQRDRLMRFDVVLANPPYSIKQWNREAFASDPWGRNLYGTPPQGRADYAFWQHILCSLAPKTGRCAILYPHGVLFRQEEADMRKKLIEADVLDCVLGLGPNLFYNSPMEACIVICRTAKPKARKGRILFINAINEVTRERAQSFLTDDHIDRIVTAYSNFKDEPGLARVVPLEEVRNQGGNLNISMYVGVSDPNKPATSKAKSFSISESLSAWLDSASSVRIDLEKVLGNTISCNPLPEAAMIIKALPSWLNRDKWAKVRFGDVVKQLKEETDPVNDGVERYVAGEHMNTCDVHIRNWGLVGDGYLGPAFIRRFKKGQVLYGSRRTYLKKVALAEWDGVTANTTFVLEAVESKLLQSLLPWIMLSDRFTQHSIRESKGSTNPYINFPDIAKYEFSLPPLDQQRRIAEILWAVEDVIEALIHARMKTKELSKAVVECHCFNPSFPRLPLGEVLDAIIAGKSVIGANEPARSGGFGVLKVSAVGPKGFDASEHKRLLRTDDFNKRFAVSKGDFLITRCNTRELVGRVCIVPENFPSLMLCDKTLKLIFNSEKVNQDLMEAVLKSKELRRQIEIKATGTGGAMKNITQDEIRSLIVPIPPLPIQKRILLELCAETECENRFERSIEALYCARFSFVNSLMRPTL